MKIIVDENIEKAKELFSQFGDVILLHGRKISNEVLKDADALIVRSITNVNKNLLENTNVKFVGTATIGRDHIDTDYLLKNNIAFADAQGCNAHAVKEYVITALTEIFVQKGYEFKYSSIGIIGAGNIGSKVAECAEVLGMKVILNDPPLQRKTGNKIYKSLDEALKADIITLHVPLNKEGINKTFHLFDKEKLKSLKDGAIIINSARGSVINNDELNNVINEKNFTVVLDVWENEPYINNSLIEKVYLGTPHIAGYSYEGKINGTRMIYSALCRFLNVKENFEIKAPVVENNIIEVTHNESIEKSLQYIFRKIYNIKEDDRRLREIKNENDPGKYFDNLRKDYLLRREFNNYTVVIPEKNNELKKILEILRFKVVVNR